MSAAKHRRRLRYDMNVPLSSVPSSPSKRRHQAHAYQTRLHQLGYHGIAFCHTAFGRLNMDKDDADVALPWGDIVATPASSSLPTTAKKKKRKSLSFGRTNSMGMKVYRRLNIIVEEVSDVSRILLPPDESPPSTSVSDLLQKYDIVSLQPMNEPALQNACELLSPSSSPSMTNSESPSNNAHLVDILVLEYATGSRGGHGLPYKLRKDYVMKALQAGLTFELCYGTAVLDPKRRQGFLRALCDFDSSYGGIQQKHTLLNKSQNAIRKRTRVHKCPLLLSSGRRQNFTEGTDAGAMALRTPEDVEFLVEHMGRGGGGVSGKVEHDNAREVHNGRENGPTRVEVFSAAERLLSRASDRASGVVVTPHSSSQHRRQQNDAVGESRSCIIGTKHTGSITMAMNRIDGGEGEEEASDASICSQDAASDLFAWLSRPLRREEAKEKSEGKADAPNVSKHKTSIVVAIETRESGERVGNKASQPLDGTPPSACNEQCGDSKEEKDDAEDGFIAL